MTQQFDSNASPSLTLGIAGFNYSDLHDAQRLADLLAVFDQSVNRHDPELFGEFAGYRACQGQGMAPEQISELLVKMAPLVGAFVAQLFKVEDVRERQIQNIRGEFDAVFV